MTIGLTTSVILFASLGYLTFEICRRQLHRRAYRRRRLPWDTLLGLAQGLLALTVLLTTAIGFFHPITLLLLATLLGALADGKARRRRQQLDALNQLVRLVAQRGGFVPDAIDEFARRTFSRIGRQAKKFSYLLRCGMSATEAMRRTGLVLDSDVTLAINDPGSPAGLAAGVNQLSLTGNGTLSGNLDWLTPSVRARLSYLAALITFSLVAGWFLRKTNTMWRRWWLDEFYSETPALSPNPRWIEMLEIWAGGLSTLVVFVAAVWLILILVCWLFQWDWALRVTPWYGTWMRDQLRIRGLRILSYGMIQSLPIEQLLDAGAQTPHPRWLRRRLRRAAEGLRKGKTLTETLNHTGLIDRTQAQWLTAAAENNDLPLATAQMADDLERNQLTRWRVRISWLVPTVVFLVGGYVLLHAYALYSILFGLIRAMA